MAIIYGKNTAVDYAAGNLASFGKSYSRMGAAPLDMTEVWYDKAALEEYAAYRGVEQADGSYDTSSVTSYVGQRVVYVNETENKVYNYSIQLDGTLKEIGTSPIGDEKSIEVATNGTVSLKGIGSLVFEREVDVLGEDGQPTGEKKTEEIKYQPLMTKAGLTWVEPSKTTVEGLALLIEALSADVKALEGKVGKAAEGENAATGLFKAIADEAKARDDADKALDAKIGAASVPETTEGAGDGKAATGVYVAIEAEAARAKAAEEALGQRITNLGDVVTEGELTEAIKDFATKKYVDDEIDAIEETISKLNHFTTKIVADVSEVTEEGILYLIKDTEATGADVYNEYLYVGGQAVLIGDTTTDLSDYYTKGETDTKFADYTTTATLETLLAGKQDNIPEGTYATPADVQGAKDYADGLAGNYDAAGSAADAEQNAKDYANTELAKKVDKVAGYGLLSEADQAKLNKLTLDDGELSISGSVEAGSVKNLDTWIGTNRNTVAGLYPTADATKVAGIEAGAQVNVIDSVVASSTAKITATKNGKEVTIDDTALVGLINNAQKDATQGITDAARAKGIAEGAAGQAATNATAISGLDTRLGTAEGKINEHTQTLATHASEYSELKGRVDAHDTAIADRALKSQVYTKDEVNAITGTPAEGKTLVGMIGDKANSADVYTKDQIYTKNEIAGITGTLAENKTLVDMINDAKTAATYNDTEVRGLISANAAAIAAEAETARAAEKKNADDIVAINTLLNTIDNEDSITSLKELAIWVEAHGSEASEMTKAIEKNAEDIAANTKKIGEVEASIPGALSAALADYKVKNVDGTTIQLSDAGVASVKAISTDLLVQGELELVLNGGSAN